mmetsp:Transcript_61083/g.126502  ORF Transcript_61083/g.126502 Transcript_61083/m.126502 type:complete len:100 (-) Transcript_61083:1917-2216(-)
MVSTRKQNHEAVGLSPARCNPELFSEHRSSASTCLVEKASDQVQYILSLHDVCQLSFGVQIFDPKHKLLRITRDDCGDWPYERHDITKGFGSHSAEIAL